MERDLMKHGFILILLSLLTGFAIPAAEAPRLAVSAHTIGLMGGVLLLAVSAVWQKMVLTEKQERVVYWGWVYSSYANWFAILFGAITGAGRMTPVAARGATASDAAEFFVGFLLISLSVAVLLAASLSILGIVKASK